MVKIYKYIFFFQIVLSLNFISLAAQSGISLASEYEKNSLFQWNWAMESLKKFPFDESDKVLDIGCGDGKITALISKSVPKGIVIGLDISEKMISHAALNFSTNNTIFIQGDATAISFDNQFDKIVSFCALNWISEQKQALDFVRKSLKQGGLFLIVIPGKSSVNLGSFAEEMSRSKKWAPYFTHFRSNRIYYTKEEYLEILNEAELEILSFNSFETIITYKNKTEIINLLRPLMNFINHLPFELQEEFIDEFVTKQIAEGILVQNDDGTINKYNIKIEVIGSKRIE